MKPLKEIGDVISSDLFLSNDEEKVDNFLGCRCCINTHFATIRKHRISGYPH